MGSLLAHHLLFWLLSKIQVLSVVVRVPNTLKRTNVEENGARLQAKVYSESVAGRVRCVR